MAGEAAERLRALRALMRDEGLDAWVVPSADPHQSEYVAPAFQRRAFLTGFDGSAGTAVVTAGQAGLWTDSRYFLQAEQQLEGSGFELFRMGEPGVPSWEDWLAAELPRGARAGVNPWVFSQSGWEGLRGKLEAAGIELVERPEDLVDRLWEDRPAPPAEPVVPHPLEFAGESTADKLARLFDAMRERSADAHLLSALDELAWLFNLRGADIAYNPVFLAWALLAEGRATLFTELDRLDPAVRENLPDNVLLAPYEAVEDALREAGARGWRVWADPSTTPRRLARLLEESGGSLLAEKGVVPGWKAVKNPVELEGMRRAHLRDGVALVRFFHWLEQAVPRGGVTELSAEARLEAFRAEGEHWRGPSFRTIAAYGPHGAIVHYAATPESDAELRPEGIFLLDSGGQYLDGTTDVTRTVALGEPTPEQRRAYTAVLKGHLALRRALFREGTDGYQLDVLARAPLWAELLHYGHGTGHGVGAYLSVHEGPFSVSLRRNLEPLAAGNVLSNEPGYYEEGAYGIRIENLVEVVPRGENRNGRFLGFEDLTLCPYDRRLIDVSALSPAEREQVDAYHRRVREALSPLLGPEERAWLERATSPLEEP